MNYVVPEDEPIVYGEEPNATEAASENHPVTLEVTSEDPLNISQDGPIINEEPNANEVASENHPNALEVTSEDSSSTNSVLTTSRPSLVSLAAEIRVLIFRHLLLEGRPLITSRARSTFQRFPAVLRTCRSIRQEAFQVMYGENTFYLDSCHPSYSILDNRQIHDAIQNVHFNVEICFRSLYTRRSIFINMLNEFGSPTIIRGALHLVFHVRGLYHDELLRFARAGPGVYRDDPLNWYARALPRFTNFRVVRIEYKDHVTLGVREDICCILYNTHREFLTPIFGPALPLADGHSLLFCPQEYLDTTPPETDVDWMEHLDGIRLNWSQDPPTNPQEPEA